MSGSPLLKAEIISSQAESIIDMVTKPPPASPREVAVLVAFGALDELIDYKLPNCVGDSFKSRAAALEKINGVSKTLVGTYRLMIPVRNEFVHKSQKKKIEFDDKFWGNILNQVRLELIFSNGGCVHAENFLAYTFENLKKSVKNFDDGAGDLPNVKAQIKYNPLFRARHSIQLTGAFGEKIKRMGAVEIPDNNGGFVKVPDEYLIKAGLGQYLVPGEFFENAAEVELEDIKHWEVSNEFLALAK